MNQAVIVSAARTAVGRAPKGTLCHTRPEYMGATVVKEALARAPGLEPADIDDVIIGCAFPEAEQGLNLGRVLALKAGLPDSVPGMTINRFCCSGLESIAVACQRIILGACDVVVAGGVESMSLIPMTGDTPGIDPQLAADRPWAYEPMGLTAENVAQKFNISRLEQDEFAVRSHKRAADAIKQGKFKDEIVPLTVTRQRPAEKGRFELYEEIFDTDEGPRPRTSMRRLAKLGPAFVKEGSVTAGNSCQMSDGAAAVVCMSRKKAEALGLEPILVYRGYAVAGVDPRYMGIGPVKAIPKALNMAGLSLDDVDLIELNEAFASQALYCIRELGLDENITNVNGGAIALGHPLGATGAVLFTRLLHEMSRRGSECRLGLVTMCVGLGMGAAGVFARA